MCTVKEEKKRNYYCVIIEKGIKRSVFLTYNRYLCKWHEREEELVIAIAIRLRLIGGRIAHKRT